VHQAAAVWVKFIRDDGVEHLVVEDVLHKPTRDKVSIQKGMNPDDAVFLLDGGKHEIGLRPLTTTPPPDHPVTPEGSGEIFIVELIENGLEIEVLPFVVLGKLPLEWQGETGNLSLPPWHGGTNYFLSRRDQDLPIV
jgi:hypothetical protein